MQLSEPTSKKAKKGAKKDGKGKENEPLSKALVQKLEAKNRRLPDLVKSFSDFDQELRLFAKFVKNPELANRMDELKIRDIEARQKTLSNFQKMLNVPRFNAATDANIPQMDNF